MVDGGWGCVGPGCVGHGSRVGSQVLGDGFGVAPASWQPASTSSAAQVVRNRDME
jgi:hypothetical protein